MREKKIRPKILCVDDEPQLLEGLALHLRRKFTVCTATSGAAGLAAISEHGPFAVVMSDMRMPIMDGATFLARVRQQAPDSVRLLLTGQTDLDSAIKAVNQGQIFRFLTKPCSPEDLVAALRAGVEQHRLITAERELLEQTLRGSIDALVDVLSLTNPTAFGRATRLKRAASKLAAALEVPNAWQVEVAAMVSQIGCVTLPADTVEKLYYGRALSKSEEETVAQLPKIAAQLLGHIPRLEGVLEILTASSGPARQLEDAPVGAAILRITREFDTLEARGMTSRDALATLRGRRNAYPKELFDAFAELVDAPSTDAPVKELPLRALRIGMVLADDVRTKSGVLLATRGYEVTARFVRRAENLRGQVCEPIRVVLKGSRNGGSRSGAQGTAASAAR